MTRNEQYWIDRSNRRMANYTISATEQAKIIQRSYNETYNYVQSEISKILRHIGDEGTLAYEYRMKRLNTLLVKMDRKMRQLYNINIKDTTSFLKKIIPEAYYHTIFDISQGLGYLPQFSAVNTRLINQIVTDQWSGRNYSERIWWNVDKLAVDTRQLLTTAAMTGESIYKTSRRLSERFGQSMYNSKRLIQTETSYVTGQAELASFRELDIAKYKYEATLDERTCPICGKLDGNIYNVKDAQPGVNYKPMHPHCHCDMISFFEGYEPTVRAARDKDGKRIKVPADMTYPEWYKKYIENGSQNTPTPSKGNDTPKPAEAPQKPSVKSTEGNAVEVPVSEPVNPSGAYTDTPLPPKINNQSIDNSVQDDIIKMKEQLNFKPAQTLEEAEQFISKYMDISQFGALGVSYKGVSVDVANQVNEQLSLLCEMFNVKKFGGIIAPAQNTKLGKQIEDAFAAYMPVRNSFVLNRSSLKNIKIATQSYAEEKKAIQDILKYSEKYDFSVMSKEIQQIVKYSKPSGRGTVHETIAETISHEFGHVLEKQVKKHRLWGKVLNDMPNYATKISGYAAFDSSEYVAESFCSWIKGEKIADPNIIKIFESLKRSV